MQRAKQFVVFHFEPLVVLVLVAATAFAVLVAVDKMVFLNFFYLPVFAAAYFLGLRQGTLVAVVAVLMVAVYAVINPGVFAASAANPGFALLLWGSFLILTAVLVGSLYEARAQSVRDLKHAYEGILGLVATLIDAVDKHAQDHSVRVAALAARVGVVLNLPNEQIETIHGGGLLHEVSKVDVNLDTLRKAALSEQETRRGYAGAALLSAQGLLSQVVDVVEAYTENFDGSGPKGLAGEQIPLGARILAVSDEYESRLAAPPYGPGLNSAEALAEVERLSGTRFDPRVVPALITAVESE